MPPQFLPAGRSTLLVVILASISSACVGPQREWPDDLVWSPDGKHAAVLTSGFRISDPDGKLTPQLDDRVYRAAWLDSERLLLARHRTVSTFAEIAAAVGPDRAGAIAAEAEHEWTHIMSPDFPVSEVEIPDNVLTMYLREHHGDIIRERAGQKWTKIENTTAELHQLVVARVVDDRLEFGVTLSEDVFRIKTIRPAPDRRSVAFVTRQEEALLFIDDPTRIFVVPIEVSARPRRVASLTGDSIDWSADSRSLVYFQGMGVGHNSDFFGCLAELTVFDTTGANSRSSEPDCLSPVFFDPSDPVTALRAGRVLFEIASTQLPGNSFGPTQLFMYDRRKGSDEAAFTPLIPEDLLTLESGIAFFEVSPDHAHVIYGTRTGDVRMLTLEDGRTELLPLGLHRESYAQRDLPHAVWSGPDAFTYVKKIGTRNEFILRRGSAETILSRSWPKEMLWPYPPDPAEHTNVRDPSTSTRPVQAARR
jgi:hypothetical protein